MKEMRSKLTLICYLLAVVSLCGQDLEGIYENLKNGSSRSLQINGGLNLSQGSYFVSGLDPRRDRFQWNANANLNLNFMGISAPFSLAFSDGNQRFNLPSYTFTGISPTYKWATAHLGDRSMHFSKYTFTGINFRGGGFDLRPGKFRASAMYGQIKRANEEDLNSLQALDPSFRRMGYAAKAGYEDDLQSIYLTVFGAEDQENSIELPQNASVVPMQNLVLSVTGRRRLFERVTLDVEFARSSLSRDKRFVGLDESLTGSSTDVFGLFDANVC